MVWALCQLFNPCCTPLHAGTLHAACQRMEGNQWFPFTLWTPVPLLWFRRWQPTHFFCEKNATRHDVSVDISVRLHDDVCRLFGRHPKMFGLGRVVPFSRRVPRRWLPFGSRPPTHPRFAQIGQAGAKKIGRTPGVPITPEVLEKKS